LPPEWNTHVVVWINKAEIETMSIDDLYNNFKIVEQSVKKYVGASSGAQNLAFMTALSTSSINDVNTVIPAYENPNGSNLLQQDLEQIHEDGLEAIDLKWQLSLLSMREKRYYQRTGKKIFINANDTARYDKSKVECFNCHKMGHFARECRVPRNKEGQFRNQDNTRKKGNNKDTSSKAILAIDGVGFDWSNMAEEQVQTNMALIASIQKMKFTAATYKRGLATVEEQLITYRNNEVLFSEEVAVLKREVACKDYEINVLKTSKDLDKLLGSQITDKSKKGLGYNVVPPPHPLIYNRPKKLDLSYSGLDEFKDPEFKSYGSEEKQVSEDTSSFVKSLLNVEKETVFLDKKIEFVKPKNHEKPVKKSVRYSEMYRSQSPRGNQRNWNGQKSNQLGSDFLMYNKACFICGSFDHVQAQCKYHQRERMGKPQQDDTGFIDSGCSISTAKGSHYKGWFDEASIRKLGDKNRKGLPTTASCLEARAGTVVPRYHIGDVGAQTRFETTSKQSNDPPLSRVNTLGSGEDSLKLIELMAHYTTLSALERKRIKRLITSKNALTECPNLYASPIEQFWQTAALSTTEDGVRGITATIDRKVKVFVSEASIRRHLKLEDSEGLKTLPTAEIFEQLALIGNMKRASKGYSGVDIPLFPTMLTTTKSSPCRITSSPSLSPQTHPSTSQPPSTPPSNQTTPVIEEAALMPHESPLQSVHSLGRDEGSLSLNELTDLYTSLSKKQSKRIAKVVISGVEEDEEDPSNREEAVRCFNAATALVDAARRRQSVENVQTYTRRRREVCSDLDSMLRERKGQRAQKQLFMSPKPPKNIREEGSSNKMSVDEELDKKVFEEDQLDSKAERKARFKAEQEQERIGFETALELQKQLDEREEVAAKVDQAHDIDWSDLAVLRYHTLQNRPFSVAEVRKNMLWDQNQAFIPMGSEIEKEVMKRSGFNLQQESSKLVEEEIVQQDDVIAEQAVKESSRTAGGRRKKSLARKRAKETLGEEKYPIVDWETQILANDKYYYQIKRADESVKHYKLFSSMLYDFDRQDVLELYKLVKERFQIASPEGYDLLLWGDLKTLIKPNEEDEIWRNQQD
ncbi:putative ribonuclease H-like domain-containing protein, partial [Tanacetum coccineum]